MPARAFQKTLDFYFFREKTSDLRLHQIPQNRAYAANFQQKHQTSLNIGEFLEITFLQYVFFGGIE